ncbi:hypothetical protein C8J55DRAFT_476614 [Lentinula edodes]|uniref:BTB domain-containing protein n=1 Tax=Lentinula lateritia TaxID=40482 RepID=A0A9W9DMU2_9AGAR|nr:hypothetical protein C8J55DRAFT_476614 [Lentinula edodes]
MSDSSNDITCELPDLAPPPVEKSKSYYFDCVVFQVENKLYKLPRAYLAAVSPIFNDMFQIPPEDGQVTEGSESSHPICLYQTRVVDWERFLKVLFCKLYIDPPVEFGFDEWASVLKLSHRWEITTLQSLAIQKIESFHDHPSQKIYLARQYHVPSFYLPSIGRLIARSEPISLEDMKYLGAECALKIASIRERVVGQSKRHYPDSFYAQRRMLSESERPAFEREIFETFEDHEEYIS